MMAWHTHGHTGVVETWATILTVAVTAIAGDVLTAGAMRRIGDLDEIRARSGLMGASKAVVSCRMFLLGVLSMALSETKLSGIDRTPNTNIRMLMTAPVTAVGGDQVLNREP